MRSIQIVVIMGLMSSCGGSKGDNARKSEPPVRTPKYIPVQEPDSQAPAQDAANNGGKTGSENDQAVIEETTYTLVYSREELKKVLDTPRPLRKISIQFSDLSSLYKDIIEPLDQDFDRINVSQWDVSKVVDMNSAFQGASTFNQPLENWDVSHVVDMDSMFFYATSFNQALGTWNTSNVTDMSLMFTGAEEFNQPLNDWDVAAVIDMNGIFQNASAFSQSLERWEVSIGATSPNMFENSGMNKLPSWFLDQ
ncbi:BspA family leucine-rich repeat surface protein [Pseudobacteriovorax antillogorgiicola]|uniref:Surface protein n=1 Tax=Pseudobacteriovorax antillogorgiicola TaxID=1513793 RepID=A0A1Y6BFB1_9BACT|nr:BspA family leucine-rich repeat surface protein [Pseudobacteriovorax antillogorgiicola]TCS57468.1 surface protein [Pseudobacteriovorax antillogorgiicola]SMF00627.1 surface protein [Pseudobacteriovorax antillogorgiicola]